MLYNFTHTHIGDLWLRLRTEEKLANLSKLIGRLLKMIKLEGAVTEKKRSPETTKGKKKPLKSGCCVRGILCSFILISCASP